MNFIRHKSLSVLAVCAFLVDPAWADDEWQVLFNGEDLSGWRTNVDPKAFTVVDGAIRANASSNTKAHLFYVGDQEEGFVRFKDFELELSARCEPNANSGVFFHTDRSTRDDLLHLAKGYEVQLVNSKRGKYPTGSLYDVLKVSEAMVDETQWFRIQINVRHKRITVKLNGQEVINYTEPNDVKRPPKRTKRVLDPKGGAIALQAHDAKSVYYFKDIRIRRLP